MIKINKNITITGVSEIEGQQVAYMSATISTDGGSNGSATKTITNQELYNANKVAVRADMNTFDKEVYKAEDEITTGGATNEIK